MVPLITKIKNSTDFKDFANGKKDKTKTDDANGSVFEEFLELRYSTIKNGKNQVETPNGDEDGDDNYYFDKNKYKSYYIISHKY